jgi:hypothetical protein
LSTLPYFVACRYINGQWHREWRITCRQRDPQSGVFVALAYIRRPQNRKRHIVPNLNGADFIKYFPNRFMRKVNVNGDLIL